MSTRTRFLSVVAAIALVAAACSSSHHKTANSVLERTEAAEAGTWVGKIDGTNALIAIVSDGVEVTVYTCDGMAISTWFRGVVNGGHPQLVSETGARLDATIAKDSGTGTFTNAAGKQFSFTASPVHDNALYRAETTLKGKHVLGGWVLGPNGEQRGAINVGRSIVPAPQINLAATTQLTNVTVPGLIPATLAVIPQSPDNTAKVTPNTTGFNDFVIAGMGDSYSVGEGNPFKPANLAVTPTLTVWDKLLAGAVLTGGTGWMLTAPGLALGAIGLPALAAATHIGGEDFQPEVITEPRVEQWGGSAQSPDAPPNEAYRVLCHQGKSPSEKAFDNLSNDAKYRNVVHFVYWNFACAGSQTRHLYKEPYDGDPDHSRSPNPLPANAVPPQLDLLRAALGDESATSSTARTFLTNKKVPFFSDQQGSPSSGVPHVDALYVSSGGNDAGFARVIMDCGILPLPDCGDGTNTFGPLNEEQLVQHGGDVNSFDPLNFDTNLHHDNAFPGLAAVPQNYSEFNQALRQLQVTRGGAVTATTPNQIYMAEGPNPLHKTATTLCNGSEGPLHNDTVGLLSATDVRYAEKMTQELNAAINAGAQAGNQSPMSNGSGHWNTVPLANLFFGHAMCQTSRFTMTGGDALNRTGNDLGVNGIFEAADGTGHPNDDGYTAMAGVFEQQLRTQVDTMIATPPAKPTRLRQVSAVQNGAIGLRWDDNANNDDWSQLLHRPPGSTGQFQSLRTLNDPDANSYTFAATSALTDEIKVKVCTRFAKCTTSDPIIVTNRPPTLPTNVTANVVNTLNGKHVGLTTNWNGADVNLMAFVDIRAQVGTSDRTVSFPVVGNGEPPVATLTINNAVDPATAGAAFPDGTYTVRVRGCNLLGCSTASPPVTVSVATISGQPHTTLPSISVPPPSHP